MYSKQKIIIEKSSIKKIIKLFFVVDLMWVPSSADSVFPANAVKGGVDLDGADIFVGRAYHDGDLLPAKVIPANNVAYVCHNGREIAKHNFEVIK